MKKVELYALGLIHGVGQKTIAIIIDYMASKKISSIENIDISELVTKIKRKETKEALLKNLQWNKFQHYIDRSNKEMSDISQKGIDIISITEKNYPRLLKVTKNPPIFLYCKGDTSLLNATKKVAVIGTRNNTKHGKLITEKTVEFLCDNKYVIVSGLALGIDTIAHQASLYHQGKTISVLVDVDNIQPSSNKDLAEEILIQGGLLVAEEKPGVRISPSMFAKRDRLQSGLSFAVFPIETSMNGGTMHAVRDAVKENRLVYVPDVRKSGYKNTNIEQLEGIDCLIGDGSATPYTKDKYSSIVASIEKKEKEFMLILDNEAMKHIGDKSLFD